MFLNNIPNKDVVVSHGLLALPSTSDSKPFDGAATAAPGEASFEGQHAALAALGQAVRGDPKRLQQRDEAAEPATLLAAAAGARPAFAELVRCLSEATGARCVST